jgi:hypothetical protein
VLCVLKRSACCVVQEVGVRVDALEAACAYLLERPPWVACVPQALGHCGRFFDLSDEVRAMFSLCHAPPGIVGCASLWSCYINCTPPPTLVACASCKCTCFFAIACRTGQGRSRGSSSVPLPEPVSVLYQAGALAEGVVCGVFVTISPCC